MADLGIGTIISVVGTVMSAAGSLAAAASQRKISEFNAQQIEAKGVQEFAVATLNADRKAREAEEKMSRARAVAAHSGGGMDYGLLGDIAEEGAYNTGLAIWEGEEAKRGRAAQAASTRFEGKAQAQASTFNAISSVFDSASTIYGQYA